jgi:hypothetical protein
VLKSLIDLILSVCFRRQVRELILCHWPNSSFDPQVIQLRFPELRILTLRDSDVSRLNEFGDGLQELQVTGSDRWLAVRVSVPTQRHILSQWRLHVNVF